MILDASGRPIRRRIGFARAIERLEEPATQPADAIACSMVPIEPDPDDEQEPPIVISD